MKYFLCLFFVIVFNGCGSSPSGSQTGSTAPQAAALLIPACMNSKILGQWYDSSSKQLLKINNDCTFSDDVCGEAGIVPNVTNNTGTVLITIKSTGINPGCMSPNSYSCAYTIDSIHTPTTMTINCGGGIISYSKQ